MRTGIPDRKAIARVGSARRGRTCANSGLQRCGKRPLVSVIGSGKGSAGAACRFACAIRRRPSKVQGFCRNGELLGRMRRVYCVVACGARSARSHTRDGNVVSTHVGLVKGGSTAGSNGACRGLRGTAVYRIS